MILHIAEVAGLMFLAFVLGSALGYSARRLTQRSGPRDMAIPPQRLAVAKGEAVRVEIAPVHAAPPVTVTPTAPVAVPAAVTPATAMPVVSNPVVPPVVQPMAQAPGPPSEVRPVAPPP